MKIGFTGNSINKTHRNLIGCFRCQSNQRSQSYSGMLWGGGGGGGEGGTTWLPLELHFKRI